MGPLLVAATPHIFICREGQLTHLFFPGRVGRGYGPGWTVAVLPALSGWLVGWLVDSLVAWLVGWLIRCLIGWLID